jgi:hypothetical protein
VNPFLRTAIAAALGSVLAVWTGFGVANQDYTLALVASAVGLWALLEWLRGPLPEAWVLAAALFGYLIGNRGFAQLSLSSQVPLLPAEAALLCGAAAVAVRTALHRTSAFNRDSLNVALGVWILLGLARLWIDVRTHGAIAVRDFATVYYAVFFFIAQSLARHPSSLKLLRGTLLAAAAALPVCYGLYRQFPDLIFAHLVFRGGPLIFYKDDLVAAYLFAGFFLFSTVPHWPVLLRYGFAALSYATAFTIDSSRAAIVGLVVTSTGWALARRWAPWRIQAALVPAALLGLLLVAFTSEKEFERSRFFALYEHVRSIVDVGGTGNYRSADREYVGDNNRFRAFWWRAVAEETLEFGPAFGLGFGANLTERFVRTYQLDLGEEFNVRSPHSIFFTVLGRMGLVGLVAWIAVVIAMVVRTRRLIRLVAADASALPILGWWSVAWMLLVSGSFGVVLEGPMGAVLFWTALGLANALTPRPADAPDATDQEAAADPAAGADPAPALRSAPARPEVPAPSP